MTADSKISSHYDKDYYAYQRVVGEFGGKANAFKFESYIKSHHTIIDFGCGGGFLLRNLECERRIGIEPNQSAVPEIQANGVEHFFSTVDCLEALGPETANVVISNHALEHVLNPLGEIKALMPLLKKGGKIHFVVPYERGNQTFKQNDINNHLYTWSPLNLGNLFMEAGYEVISAGLIQHLWPPYYRRLAAINWNLFHGASRLYARMNRRLAQTEVIAVRPGG